MANMSYCKFQNTSRDMDDCLEDMREAYENADTLKEYLATLSKDEQYGFNMMRQYCLEFVRLMEDMER
jgi:hypothetical protein